MSNLVLVHGPHHVCHHLRVQSVVVSLADRDSKQVRAKLVRNVDAETTLSTNTSRTHAVVCTDESTIYSGLPHAHKAVKHSSVGEYERGMAHTNGTESFWAMLKRDYDGAFHKMSSKHLNRYVQNFAGKHNIRKFDTVKQMRAVIARLVGKDLLYRYRVKSNGLSNTASNSDE